MKEETRKHIAERLGNLLAISHLSAENKSLILDNLDKFPDYLVFDLMDTLEGEGDTDAIVMQISQFFVDHNEDIEANISDDLAEEELPIEIKEDLKDDEDDEDTEEDAK